MARITKRQVEAAKKADAERNKRYNKVMKNLRPVIILRLGIMNFISSQEVLDMLDMFSEEEKSGKIKECFKTLENSCNVANAAIRLYYRDMDAQYAYYMDICNVAYSWSELYIKKMKDCIERKYTELGTSDVKRKSQISISNAMLSIAYDVFKGIRRHNIAKNRIDIGPEMEAFSTRRALNAISDLVHEYAQIPEIEKSINFFDVEGIREVYDEFCEYVGGANFLDDMCKKAILLNKKDLPEVYNALIKNDD